MFRRGVIAYFFIYEVQHVRHWLHSYLPPEGLGGKEEVFLRAGSTNDFLDGFMDVSAWCHCGVQKCPEGIMMHLRMPRFMVDFFRIEGRSAGDGNRSGIPHRRPMGLSVGNGGGVWPWCSPHDRGPRRPRRVKGLFGEKVGA